MAIPGFSRRPWRAGVHVGSQGIEFLLHGDRELAQQLDLAPLALHLDLLLLDETALFFKLGADLPLNHLALLERIFNREWQNTILSCRGSVRM